MLNDNPIYPLAKKKVREYQKSLGIYGKQVENVFKKYKATTFNQIFLQKWLFNIADSISKDTQRALVDDIDEVILKTINTYNKMHKGDKLSDTEIEELSLEIRKDFLLSEYKGKTLDQRISQANRRLKVNLLRELQNLITDYANGSYPLDNLINSITGKDYKEGGTALRWNSRLVLSEMYRAYQFTAKVVLARLGVKKIEWVNSPRHTPNDSIIDKYTEKVYEPSNLPDYPYPCNDSYFIPIY